MINYPLRAYLRLREYYRRYFHCQSELDHFRRLEKAIIDAGRTGYRVEVSALGLNGAELNSVNTLVVNNGWKVVADIDRNGEYLFRVSHQSQVRTVQMEIFQRRTRSDIQVVTAHGYLGVKKDYRGNFWSFVNELQALQLLRERGVRAPVVMEIDYQQPSIIVSYIKGRTLLEILSGVGEKKLSYDFVKASNLQRLSRMQQNIMCLDAALPDIWEVIDRHVYEIAVEELGKIHSVRVLWNDIKYGNIIIEETSGEPYFIDYEYARFFPELPRRFFEALSRREEIKLRSMFFGVNH